MIVPESASTLMMARGLARYPCFTNTWRRTALLHTNRVVAASQPTHFHRLPHRDIQEQIMKGQEGKKTAKKEPAKTMKEKKADKKVKKEEKQRQ